METSDHVPPLRNLAQPVFKDNGVEVRAKPVLPHTDPTLTAYKRDSVLVAQAASSPQDEQRCVVVQVTRCL